MVGFARVLITGDETCGNSHRGTLRLSIASRCVRPDERFDHGLIPKPFDSIETRGEDAPIRFYLAFAAHQEAGFKSRGSA